MLKSSIKTFEILKSYPLAYQRVTGGARTMKPYQYQCPQKRKNISKIPILLRHQNLVVFKRSDHKIMPFPIVNLMNFSELVVNEKLVVSVNLQKYSSTIFIFVTDLSLLYLNIL